MAISGAAAASVAASAASSMISKSMNGSGSGGSSSDTSTTNKAPWAPQAVGLINSYNAADGIYAQQKDNPSYTGQLYSPINDMQKGAAYAGAGWSTGQGLTNQWAASNSGNYLVDQSAYPYAHNAQTMAEGNFGNVRGMSGGTQGALDGSSQANLTAGAHFGSNAQGLMEAAQGDPTQRNINSAGQYMNNDVLNGQIDAASRDVTRNLYENQLPTLNQQASAGGALNSSRAGAAEAVAQRGAADRIADISSQLRGTAYNNGLNLAESSRAANQTAAISANTQVGSASTIGGYNANSLENMRENDVTAKLAANNQLGQGYQMGLAGLNAAGSLANQNFALGSAAGGVYQNDANAQLQAQQQQWQNAQNGPWNLLSKYQGVYGGQNWGGQTTTSTPYYGPNALQQGIGLASGAAGLYGQFKNLFPTSASPSPPPTSGAGPNTNSPIYTDSYFDPAAGRA